MSHHPWYYFLFLEKEFIRTIDFVELHPDNAKTFSNEYAKLLLLIGSEVDVVAKMLCEKVAPTKKLGKISEYRDVLTATFNGFHTVQIDIPRYDRKVQPWQSWNTGTQSPCWWKAYNNVKHNRDKHYADANQENTLFALCGWLALLLYFFRADEKLLQPFPGLLDHGFPDNLVAGDLRKLPGA